MLLPLAQSAESHAYYSMIIEIHRVAAMHLNGPQKFQVPLTQWALPV